MQERYSVVDRIEGVAYKGKFYIHLNLWKQQISKLEKEGFVVKILNPTNRPGEYSCIIYWNLPTKAGIAMEMQQLSLINVVNQDT